MEIPIATIIQPSLVGANGRLYLGSNIKTFYTINGVGKWYYGKITKVLDDNCCAIEYKEGFSVEGTANCVFLAEKTTSTQPFLETKVVLADRS